MSLKLPISVVIITLNEEKHIRQCIQSVPFASEVIVVDSESTDRTVEMAGDLGAKVEVRPWPGHRKQKEYACSLAHQPWILSLDADEYLSAELAQEIIDRFKSGEAEKLHGFRMPRCSFHLGRWIRHGGWYPDYQLRLFKSGQAHWVGEKLHEKLELKNPEKLGTLQNDLQHEVFEDLADQVDTNNKYSTLGAMEYLESGKKFSVWKLLVRPFGKFVECYLLKKGFLDGLPGFIIAVGASYSLFLRYSKLWELQRRR